MGVFRLPDLGEGLTEAELMRWIVQVGDVVVVDQPIAEVETAKSVVELPSPFAGTVAVLHAEEGQTVAVGSPLIEIASAVAAGAPTPIDVEREAYRAEERAGSGNVLIGYGTTGSATTGRTRRRRATPAAPSVVRPAAPGSGPVAVRSPIVRSLARSRGVDLRALHPSAADGIIRRADVLGAVPRTDAPPVAAAPAGPAMAGVTAPTAPTAPTAERAGELAVVSREPLGMLRRTVAAKLSRSRSEIPEATVWVDVDATALWDLRRSMGEAAPSFTSMVARFTLLALADSPVLAGRLSDDGTEIIQYDGVNLGVAADTERGLVVPVVPHAERHSITELDAAVRRLTESARSGTASPAELTGSTFTLNNYGSLGVDGSAAIINHPEVAILGLGRMIERPWVVDGTIVPRRILQLSLVFDHRVCDGGYAARFLRTVVAAIENPLALYGRL